MTFFHSIRTRLTLWYTAWLLVSLLAFGAISYFVTNEVLMDNLDRSLRNEVNWVNEFIEPKAKKVRLKKSAILELRELQKSAATQPQDQDEQMTDEENAEVDEMWNQIYQHTLMSPRRHYIQILDRNGDLLYRSLSLAKTTISYSDIPYGTVHLVTIESPEHQNLRLAVMQNDYVKVFVAYPLGPINEVLDNLFANFGIIAPMTLLISIIGGWFLAHISLRPVDMLTRTAREITAQNLNQRLPAHEVDDEIGRLTAQLNDMIGRLQASFAQIQQFSADASHELRTPLTIMRGEIEVALRGHRLNAPTQELLNSVHDELVRLSSIVESLMTLVKSDSGRLVFDVQDVLLNQIISQIAADAQMLAERKRIAIIVIAPNAVHVNGDAKRLRQLFLSLVENAVKFSSQRGTITLALEQQNGNAVVNITDTGAGISRKDQPRIFDRFYRGRQPKNGDFGGSGLGLSIAKWIAEAHRGTIEVKSREGKGSTFTVKLPSTSLPVR